MMHSRGRGRRLEVTLGDRTRATVPYTVRFRLVPDKLRQVHERFGPAGVFGIVRDASSAAVSAALRDPAIGIDDMFGAQLEVCQKSVARPWPTLWTPTGSNSAPSCSVPPSSGGPEKSSRPRFGAARARAREGAEAPTRLARAANDADLQQNLTLSNEDAWRCRRQICGVSWCSAQALQVAIRPQAPEWSGSRPVIGLSRARRSRPRMHNRERELRSCGRPLVGADRRRPPGHHDGRHRLVRLSGRPMERTAVT